MKIYVNANARCDGNGSQEKPFKRINEAAQIARPGDTVLVYPGVYREYVDPQFGGEEDQRIVYKSVEPLKAVITGAEILEQWEQVDENVWKTSVPNSIFGNYNPYTTLVYGDWYFAKPDKHTGCVYRNGRALYEAASLEACKAGEVYECSWVPEESIYKWYAEQDEEKDQTVIYVNLHGADPNQETMEFNVRRMCFFPAQTGRNYITVDGFTITMAATNWAPPAAWQDGMIGPHWSKGWIIENCDISNSKCAGISLGKYLDPDNNHYFTYKYVKSPTQMERDAVCRGQYHGWVKEKVGSHLIRHNHIHHCEQGGIIGRMGGVFSVIEDNHIHHINNMMELGGAEIAGIKMHAAIDVTYRRNHIHHCTMGIWCDWEAQGTRITQNLFHDNQRPAGVKQLVGGMMSQDIFVEVGHGPTLIDNNLLLSDATLRFATDGVAMVHNLICGALTCVGGGTGDRYTPYHMPHRTEVMGFMTFLHGDDRFYNNLFVQKWPSESFDVRHDSDTGHDAENRLAGTWPFDEYPTYDEWIAQFDFTHLANMRALEPAHNKNHLPVWAEGNAYFGGAKAFKKEKDNFFAIPEQKDVKVELVEKEGAYYLDTNIYDALADFTNNMIKTETLGKAFEPEQPFENPDGTPITFNVDFLGDHRSVRIIPGPFVSKASLEKPLMVEKDSFLE